jgi:predicted nucleic acid-binding protein
VKIADAFQGISRIFLDTSPVVYHFEKNPAYLDVTAAIFSQIDNGTLTAVTSPVTLAESLVQPYQRAHVALQQAFMNFIMLGNNTLFTPMNDSIASKAAELRARHNIGLMDAFQFSTALATSCDALLTNDFALRRVTEIKVIMIDDLEL